MNPFEGIAEFVAVAESEGFTPAARQLGVSTSHISRRLADLESRLGIVLVARTTRRVKLTTPGLDYYQRCRQLLNGIEEANQAITEQHTELRGVLRVSAPGEFAENHVIPQLIEFAAKHPKLSLDIDFNARIPDIVAEGFDLAIRYGQIDDNDLVAHRLLDRNLVAAASPSYIENHGAPKHPDELRRHQCLIAASDTWEFNVDGERKNFKVSGRWRSNSGRSILNACRAGLGIANLPKSSYGSALSDGSLMPILTRYACEGVTSWVVHANRKYLPLKARLAVEFLLEHFNDNRE